MNDDLAAARQYIRQGRILDASRLLDAILATSPCNAAALKMLAEICYQEAKYPDTMGLLDRAIQAEPKNSDLHFSLAAVLQQMGELDRAIASYKTSLDIQKRNPACWMNLGLCYFETMRYSEAIESYANGLVLCPEDLGLNYNLGLAYMRCGKAREADTCFRTALRIDPDCDVAYSCFLFNLHYLESPDPDELLREHVAWGSRKAVCDRDDEPGRADHPGPDNRLRVGYVSADFRAHSVASFITPILRGHDTSRFRIYCYSNVRTPDDVTLRIRSLVDTWRDIHGVSDEVVARKIREDGIDILVDLGGHTADNRLKVFSLAPAPVQISYLGYPDTTGLPAMDYRLTDRWADEKGVSERYCTEQLIRLDTGFLCYEPQAEVPEVGELPALQAGYPTFASFNNIAKLSDSVVSLWSRVLLEAPDSRLLLKARGLDDRRIRNKLLQTFKHAGVDPARVQCIDYCRDIASHLSLYGKADIALDAFPYNGTTTTCEALYMGVPVITLAGDRHSSRVGASILTNAGLPGYVARSADDFVKIAVEVSSDLQALERVRKGMRERLRASALMDAGSFVAKLETEFLRLCAKK